MENVVERAQDVRRNEEGMETIQTVLITGISAVTLAALYQWKWSIIAWVQSIVVLFFKIPL